MSERFPKSPFLRRTNKRRQIDFDIMVDWIEEGSRVLDLGCGRGILLRELMDRKSVYGVGVDSNPEKIASCVKRGVNAFQEDVAQAMDRFTPHSFDYVVLTRTLELIEEPGEVIQRGLSIGRSVIVGAVNRAYWRNRISFLLRGRTTRNAVYPLWWEESPLSNHLSVDELHGFAERSGLEVARSVYLRGDWKTPCNFLPNWLAGYGIFELRERSE
ncbi:MAG: methionine biosynthesis protein MetW [Puniceicoccales bacterium]